MLTLLILAQIEEYVEHERGFVFMVCRSAILVALAVQWQVDRRKYAAAPVDQWFIWALIVATMFF